MRAIGVEELLGFYERGVFPMAQSRHDDRIFVMDPDERGVLPIDDFHIPRSLKKTVRKDIFQVTINRSFNSVVHACADSAPGREDTWINEPIQYLYSQLHTAGHAHSVECWKDGALVGGLYGVSLGGAFFGESMFSRQTDASKIALVHLIARLKTGNYQLLDTQFITTHLQRFGTRIMTRDAYKEKLAKAVQVEADFFFLNEGLPGSQILQSITQKS